MRAPGITSCIRLRIRMNVDFPQPDGPISAVTCLGSIVRLTSSIAFVDPYHALRPPVSSRFDISADLHPAAAGHEPGDSGQDQNNDDESEGHGPRTPDRHVERRAGLREDEQRQTGLRPPEWRGPDGVEAEGGE